MIGVGKQVPGARVWRSTRDSLNLPTLADEGSYLLFFYLFDWSST